MLTQCPQCRSSQPISAKKLRKTRGMLRCSECDADYDALELLSDKRPIKKKPDLAHIDAKIIKTSRPLPKLWGLGITFCISLFIFQVYYFEANTLAQNPTTRPWLQKITLAFKKKLKTYKNIDDFTILQGSLEPIDADSYFFKAAIINQAIFPQKHPAIKLTLLDFTGSEFATRIFSANDYLYNPKRLIKPDASTEISLIIATPPQNIGGYHFELI